MKKLYFAIFIFSFISCMSADVINAQDVFGRARTIDTTYLDANDFNPGEVIIVDTSGGQNVFVGTDIASSLNQPEKLVFVIPDTTTGGGGDIAHKVIYSTVSDTTFVISTLSDGFYEFNFSASLFLNKRVMINITPSPTVLTGDAFDPSLTIKGYVHIPVNGISLNTFYLLTTNTSGLVRWGILQPKTIIEITIYPL